MAHTSPPLQLKRHLSLIFLLAIAAAAVWLFSGGSHHATETPFVEPQSGEAVTARRPEVALQSPEEVSLGEQAAAAELQNLVPPATSSRAQPSPAREEAFTATPPQASGSPKSVRLLGRFASKDIPPGREWETLKWEAHWLEPDTDHSTDLSRLDFSGSWVASVRPGPVSIECRFPLDNGSQTIITMLEVFPCEGSPNYPVPERLRSWGGPFASEFVTIDLTGKLSIDHIIIEPAAGVLRERIVGVLFGPNGGEWMNVAPDSAMNLYLVTPPSDSQYRLTLRCDDWPEQSRPWLGLLGCRELRITYP